MKKRVLLAAAAVFCFFLNSNAEGLIKPFLESDVSAVFAYSPELELNAAAGFSFAGGATAAGWFDGRLGAAFYSLSAKENTQEYLNFFPVFLGLRLNVLPEFPVYFSAGADYGFALCSRDFMGLQESGFSAYYSLSAAVNVRVEDNTAIALFVENPVVISPPGISQEVRILKAGLKVSLSL
jgi:hypothetical protein